MDAHSVILVCMHRAPETYIHRVGRTGRFGAEGIAVSLVANNQVLDSFPPSLPPFIFLPSPFSLPSPRIALPVLVVRASFHHASDFRPSGLLLPLLSCRNGISCAPLNETTPWASRHRLVRKPVRTKGSTSKGGRTTVGQHGRIIFLTATSLCASLLDTYATAVLIHQVPADSIPEVEKVRCRSCVFPSFPCSPSPVLVISLLIALPRNSLSLPRSFPPSLPVPLMCRSQSRWRTQ